MSDGYFCKLVYRCGVVNYCIVPAEYCCSEAVAPSSTRAAERQGVVGVGPVAAPPLLDLPPPPHSFPGHYGHGLD